MYNSLEQRMARSYSDLFPEFIPNESAGVSVSEQKEFYELMKALYELAYHEPLLFVPTLHEDDRLTLAEYVSVGAGRSGKVKQAAKSDFRA